jgi:hypothetical protein
MANIAGFASSTLIGLASLIVLPERETATDMLHLTNNDQEPGRPHAYHPVPLEARFGEAGNNNAIDASRLLSAPDTS